MLILGTASLGAGVLIRFVTVESGPDLLPPSISGLKDLYGKPFIHGCGLDLQGYGPTHRYTQVQAHTLKPGGLLCQLFVEIHIGVERGYFPTLSSNILSVRPDLEIVGEPGNLVLRKCKNSHQNSQHLSQKS